MSLLPEAGRMFFTGGARLGHAHYIELEDQKYFLYDIQIDCRTTVHGTPTIFGIFHYDFRCQQPLQDGIYNINSKVSVTHSDSVKLTK
jgi:hypothetical protein